MVLNKVYFKLAFSNRISVGSNVGEGRTAVNVAGRKNTVTAAMVLIAALSRSVARATVFESSATVFIAVLLRMPVSAIRTDASVSRMFSALSFCAIRLYNYYTLVPCFAKFAWSRSGRTYSLYIAVSSFFHVDGAPFILLDKVLKVMYSVHHYRDIDFRASPVHRKKGKLVFQK